MRNVAMFRRHGGGGMSGLGLLDSPDTDWRWLDIWLGDEPWGAEDTPSTTTPRERPGGGGGANAVGIIRAIGDAFREGVGAITGNQAQHQSRLARTSFTSDAAYQTALERERLRASGSFSLDNLLTSGLTFAQKNFGLLIVGYVGYRLFKSGR